MAADPAVTGQAFGLGVASQVALEHLAPVARGAPPERSVTIRAVDVLSGAGEGYQPVIDRRGPGGTKVLTVDRHPELGYRIEAQGYGLHRVSGDGAVVESVLGGDPGQAWYRLLFAQVLPMAAALQGLELLHAGAVVLDGAAVGFVAASGTGKSSITAHLVASGAGFLTDDVLAVQSTGEVALAHPGAAYARIQEHELDRLGEAGRRLGARTGSDDKVLVAPTPPDTPVPLRTLAFVRREPEAEVLTVEPMSPPDPRLLLASTFVPHAAEAHRLEAQLEAAAAVSRHVRCVRVQVPDALDASQTAAELAERLVEAQ